MLASSAEAQRLLPGRFGAAVYGGISYPTGTFGDEAKLGWHGGAYLEADLYAAIDLRLDGIFTKFGTKEISDEDNTAELSSEAFIYTLAAELNMGADSAAYPGDNTISPWIIAGPGIYRFDFEGECTRGTCGGVDVSSVAETHWGINFGGGATVPLGGLRFLVEGRYHIVFPKRDQTGNLTMLLLSAGIKF